MRFDKFPRRRDPNAPPNRNTIAWRFLIAAIILGLVGMYILPVLLAKVCQLLFFICLIISVSIFIANAYNGQPPTPPDEL